MDILQFHEQHAQVHSINVANAGSLRFSYDMLRLEQTVSICARGMKWSNILELEVIASNALGDTTLVDYCCDKNFACILTTRILFKIA